MGLRQLQELERFLKTHRRWHLRTELMNELRVHYYTLIQCLDYLVKKKEVTVCKKGTKVMYKWSQSKKKH